MNQKIVREVNLYTREFNYIYESNSPETFQHFQKCLENGVNLLNNGDLPIICRMICDYVSVLFPSEIGHWMPHSVVIPENGISKKGYVKKIWIARRHKKVEYDSKEHIFIEPFLHNSDSWIHGFSTSSNGLITLLASKSIKSSYICDEFLYRMVE